MKTIHYTLGLPRSGSTLLMNILQQNSQLFTTGTCPTPYLIDSCKNQASSVSEFIALDQDILNSSLTSFIKQGTDGWFSSMTNRPHVISKSRVWDTYLNFLFYAYSDPKFIVVLRDIRDIVCSFEKLLYRYQVWNIGTKETPFHTHSLDKRIENYCTDIGGNLGRPLYYLPHVVEWAQKKPRNFFFLRIEDFSEQPEQYLQALENFLGVETHSYDLTNIQQTSVYEHDTVYRALVSHKTEPSFRKLQSSWKNILTRAQSHIIIHNNEWFYKTFYPEVFNDNTNFAEI